MKTNNEPLVSIIIPVYNGEDYVKEAIDSALNQTYKNKEIIVINDGSKDTTEDICKQYGNKIRYFKKENGGVSTALNLALEKMKGEYFSWLSHDDLYYPNKIEEEIKEIEKDTIILSNYDLIDKKGKLISKIILPHDLIERNHEYALFKGLINGITLLIPKKAFQDTGIFKEELRCTQDYDMWFRMLLKNYKFKHITEVLASSRQHSAQTTNTSPKILIEGNKLWINMMDLLPNKTKQKISGSNYNFYREIKKTLKESPYKEAHDYAEKQMEKEEEKFNIDLEQIKISVIMPFYDESKETLTNSINSVLNQSHKNLELIVINDNPSKFNKKTIEDISKDKRIKYIENSKNLGVSLSRNNGIKEARGEYISFLDADDEFMPEKIKTQLKLLLLTNQNFSHTSYIRSGSEDVIVNSGLLDGLVYRQCIYSCGIAMPTVMIKKTFWNENNFTFKENIHIGEDVCLWLEMLIKTPIIGIDIPLSKVNIDDSSAAYNNEKQVIGIKNILNYVLNNEILKTNDKEIAELARDYSHLVLKHDDTDDIEYKYYKIINNPLYKLTKPFRLLYKTIISIKDDGIKLTINKIKRYICLRKK